MQIAPDGKRAAGNTDARELLSDRRPGRVKLLTRDTHDHRTGVGENLGDDQPDDEREPLIRSHAFETARDEQSASAEGKEAWDSGHARPLPGAASKDVPPWCRPLSE